MFSEQRLVKQVQVRAVCGEWPKFCLSAGKALILITEPKVRVMRRHGCPGPGVGVALHRVGKSGPLLGRGSRGGTLGLRAGGAAEGNASAEFLRRCQGEDECGGHPGGL